ncbi:MAG: phage tail tube protein [Gammaproteobacteria bacterium]
MANKLFGRAVVAYDGNQLRVDKGAKLNTGGIKRNTVVGMQVEGFAEEAVEASVEVSIFMDASTDLDALNAAEDVTVLFTADSGQQYVLSHAWLAEPTEATAATDGGKVPLKFCSASAEKL